MEGADEERDGQGAEAEKDAQDVQGRPPLLAFVEVARQGVVRSLTATET